MKANRMKQILAKGQVPIGHMVGEFGTRNIARIVEAAGVDFVVIDMEHTGFTSSDIADMIAWFKATSVAPLVRVPVTDYHFIARTLDVGALGVMVPNVKSGEQAQVIVDAAKYTPLGGRGLITGAAHSDWKSVNAREFMEESNANTAIICQIESQEGLDNLEDIASTAGVDVLWVGHGDLTNSLGIVGQYHHPRFLDALKRVVEVARKHGLGAGIQPGNLEQAWEWIEIGFNVISYSMDARFYLGALAEAIRAVREMTG